MFNFNPGDVPATKSSMEFVASLLAVVSDPKAAVDHLDQMRATLAEIAAQQADLQVKTSAAQEAHKAADEALSERGREIEKRESALADIRQAETAAEDRRAAADAAEKSLAAAKQQHQQREVALQQAETVAVARQHALDQRAAELDTRSGNLAADEADYRQRIIRLKEIAK